ncbi:terpenoid synthase [Macrolepiota fuliginosa MF-IS2]|uniref:Terpene synthase n=1 Tax=Macrolepiota fuliginosa MF-IS2 TaxID=1400762 RepID=A0A9P5XPH8_9AGAR|nr:terpenoid synthase [Macrolepiota fuliginosa MF-IS2]
MSGLQQFILPDLLTGCPLKDGTNPYYREAGADSRAWINSFHIFANRKRADFVQGLNELLCSHAYCYTGYEQFRTTCDFVNVLFVVDEISDEQTGKDARNTCFSFAEAMRNPDSDDQSVVARITREFRARLVRLAGSNNLQRFIKLCEDYTRCVVREAELREAGEVLSTEEFIPLRRNNSAVLLCFSLIECALGVDLPDEMYKNPTFMKAYWAACDHVCWANDVYSYNVEQSKGQSGNNVVTVLMNDRNISLQEACDVVGVHCQQFVDDYLSARDELRATVGGDASRVVEAMGNWIIGNVEWSFESPRYFGHEHDEVKRTLTLTLRPSEAPEEVDSDSDCDSE